MDNMKVKAAETMLKAGAEHLADKAGDAAKDLGKDALKAGKEVGEKLEKAAEGLLGEAVESIKEAVHHHKK